MTKAFGGIGYRSAISSETRGTCTGRTVRSGLPSAGRLFQKQVLPPRLLLGAGRGCFASKQRPLIQWASCAAARGVTLTVEGKLFWRKFASC